MVKRYAIVRNARSRREAEAYLPDNYKVTGELYAHDGGYHETPDGLPYDARLVFVIEGRDAHGWTLDGYVIPRYASGLIFAEEIDLSHPAMKAIPVVRK